MAFGFVLAVIAVLFGAFSLAVMIGISWIHKP